MPARSTILIIILACILAGCDDISYTDNRVLGKYPSVYVELRRQLRFDRREMNLDIRKVERKTRVTDRDDKADSVRKMERRERKVMKVRGKYSVIEMERRQAAARAGGSEIERLRGNAVPFSFEYADPDFDVRSVVISGADLEAGTISLAVEVVALRDLAVSPASIYYVVLDGSRRKWLYKGYIDPFRSSPGAAHSGKNSIPAGDACNSGGSLITIEDRKSVV